MSQRRVGGTSWEWVVPCVHVGDSVKQEIEKGGAPDL